MIFDLFLDESGLFDSELEASKCSREFPSQIAGVLCNSGAITGSVAISILNAACVAGQIETKGAFHANDHSGKPKLGNFVLRFTLQLEQRRIQAVRLVNTEDVSFGDRISTYTNVLAELIVRVCQQLEFEGHTTVLLNVIAARVVAEDDDTKGLSFIDAGEYKSRINEVFARAAIANGFNSAQFKWKVSSFQIRSARDDKRLQIADVVSYFSHDNFYPLRKHPDAQAALRSALTKYDWTFSCDEILTRVREFVQRESYASALISLAERANAVGVSEESKARYLKYAGEIVDVFSSVPAVIRKSQFQILSGWLSQVAEQRDDLSLSLASIQWMQEVLCSNSELEDWPHDWLRLLTDTWALTACNHDANTIEGREYADRIDSVVPKLSSRWEYADDLMFAFILKAVHLNDCFEHKAAAQLMASVVGYYESLDGFFADAFEGVFPEKVLSDLRARALGTQLQSEMALLLRGEGDPDRCRELSDKAISEFQYEGDRGRQWQYRCELETILGEWQTAREFLAKSVDASEFTHDAIASHIQKMDDGIPKAFALLHFCRIGSMAATSGSRSEACDFVAAFERAKLQHSPWCLGDTHAYPTHGILRHLAVATASMGNANGTLEFIGRLRRVVDAKPRSIFQLVLIVSHLQSAALLAESDRKTSARLLFGDKKRLGAIALIQILESTVVSVQEGISELLENWRQNLASQTLDCVDCGELLRTSRSIGY